MPPSRTVAFTIHAKAVRGRPLGVRADCTVVTRKLSQPDEKSLDPSKIVTSFAIDSKMAFRFNPSSLYAAAEIVKLHFANPVGTAAITSRRNFFGGVGAFGSLMWNRNCRYCGSPFVAAFTPQFFCTPVCRFWSKVQRNAANECWPWLAGARTKQGYGNFRPRPDGQVLAHIFAWTLNHGPVPDGIKVCHTCDNPPCCNPAHLFLGTQKENMQDCAKKGRRSFLIGERHGMAVLNEAQVSEIRTKHKAGVRLVDLALQFNTSSSLCWRIVNRRIWRHLT